PLPVSLAFEGREALEALQDLLLRAGLWHRATVPTFAVAGLAHPFRTWVPRFPAATPGARVSTHSPREARPDASRVPCRDHFRSRIPPRHSPPRASPGDSVSTHGGSAPRPAVLWSNGPPEDRSSPQRRVFALPRGPGACRSADRLTLSYGGWAAQRLSPNSPGRLPPPGRWPRSNLPPPHPLPPSRSTAHRSAASFPVRRL